MLKTALLYPITEIKIGSKSLSLTTKGFPVILSILKSSGESFYQRGSV